MGITIFDLFNEIMTEEDMKRFLFTNGINEEFFGHGLALRSLLQMIELSPVITNTTVVSNSNTEQPIEECHVKVEEIDDSYDEMIGYSGTF